ncbi:helix-turn-helix transcriptional regulator, partial [Clostridium perfringens]|nr:helix-turn-helix transcriptional regulator [Clostridium perfringens]
MDKEAESFNDELLKQAIALTIKEKRSTCTKALSQGALAEKAEVHLNTILQIEKARMCPTISMLARLAIALEYGNEFEIFKYIEEKYLALKTLNDIKSSTLKNAYEEIHSNTFRSIP